VDRIAAIGEAGLDRAARSLSVGSLSAAEQARALAGPGLALRTGPFSMRLRTDAPTVIEAVRLLYEHYPLLGEDDFCDFALDVRRPANWRRWYRPQVQAYYDGMPTFEPLPLGHAFPLFEWTFNWCVTTHAFECLTLHAAVVERDGRAAILPAPPGSGKSTLCAALVHRGWRLLSDELALVSLADGRVRALARPVSLKNRSLEVIGQFAPQAVFSALTHDTSKGTVAHMKVPQWQVERMDEPALPAWVVFPRYVADAPPMLVPRAKADAMMELGRNAFNYSVLGAAGYHALADLVSTCECHDFSYGRLDDAMAVFDALAGAPHA
jgi:hypothetical protein